MNKKERIDYFPLYTSFMFMGLFLFYIGLIFITNVNNISFIYTTHNELTTSLKRASVFVLGLGFFFSSIYCWLKASKYIILQFKLFGVMKNE